MGRLEDNYGLEVVVPDAPDRDMVNDVIYSQLVKSVVDLDSKRRYLEVIGRLLEDGAEGVIAECTEIELLVGPNDVAAPYFPTTNLHALAAADRSLQDLSDGTM